MAAPPNLPSLPLLFDELRRELDLQEQHWQALDSKAGVLLGFAAGIVALSINGSIWLLGGQLAAVGAALLAIRAMSIQRRPLWNAKYVRAQYPTHPEEKVLRVIYDTRLAEWTEMNCNLGRKAKRVRLVTWVLASSPVLLIVGSLLERR